MSHAPVQPSSPFVRCTYARWGRRKWALGFLLLVSLWLTQAWLWEIQVSIGVPCRPLSHFMGNVVVADTHSATGWLLSVSGAGAPALLLTGCSMRFLNSAVPMRPLWVKQKQGVILGLFPEAHPRVHFSKTQFSALNLLLHEISGPVLVFCIWPPQYTWFPSKDQ